MQDKRISVSLIKLMNQSLVSLSRPGRAMFMKWVTQQHQIIFLQPLTGDGTLAQIKTSPNLQCDMPLLCIGQ